MRLGFTGTREEPSSEQATQLNYYLFDRNITLVRHGACRGADALMHRMSLWYGLDIWVHPPTKTNNMMTPDWNHDNVHLLPHKDYHPRNRDIVNGSDRLLVMPRGPWQPSGGTWWTHDYAKSLRKPLDIIWPDGRLEVGASAP